MKYSSHETLKDPKRQIILKLLFDTSMRKKKWQPFGKQYTGPENSLKAGYLLQKFFERDGTIHGQTKAENLRIQKQISPTVPPPKYLELLPITMHNFI